jgi:hypothetical protein
MPLRGWRTQEGAIPEHDRVGEALDSLAGDTSRRGFLARVGAGVIGLAFGGAIANALKQEADAGAYTNFCGHTYTTGNCIHPYGLPRIDHRGYPIRPSDGRRVDNIGRLVNDKGQPVRDDGSLMRDPDGIPIPPAPRTQICQETARAHNIEAHLQGAWYRCCGGTVRKLWDCCSQSDTRINGDAALRGYCYGSRKVFCVTYYQTHVKC